MLEDYSTPHGKRYFVNLSWVIPCCEQKLGIGAQAMCIACNDTSVIVINFRKSKTHAITDTYCTHYNSTKGIEKRQNLPVCAHAAQNSLSWGVAARRPSSHLKSEWRLRETVPWVDLRLSFQTLRNVSESRLSVKSFRKTAIME